MHRFTALVFLFLLITISPYSQQNNNRSGYINAYTKAEKLFNSANPTEITDSLAMDAYLQAARILIREKIYNDTLTDIFLKCGILKMSGNDPQQALQYFRQSVYTIKQNTKLPDSLLFKPDLYMGSVHYSLNNLDSAVYYYKMAEGIYSLHPDLNESERLFNKFGALYFETGDYNKSISYFEKALAVVEGKTPVNIFFIINYKNNIATALMKLGRYNQALEIYRDLLKYGKPADALLYNIGTTYFEKGDNAEALKWLRQVRNMDFERMNSLTKIFIRQKQYDSARFYISKAKMLYGRTINFSSKVTFGMIMKYSGDLNIATGNSSEALKDYQLAINSMDPAFSDTAIASNPTAFSGLQNFLFLFDVLVAKAALLNKLYDGRQDTRLLEHSVHAYESAFSLVKHIEKTYFSDEARIFLKNKVNPATQDAVDVSIRLFNKTRDQRYIQVAFGFVENNKASVLQAGLKNLELSSIPNLPAGLVSDEKRYRTAIAKASIQLTQLRDSLMYTALQGKIHELEVSLATVQDKLDENPVYHSLKFGSSSVNMDSLSANLKQDEAILAYYYTATQLVCFYITGKETGFVVSPLRDTLFSTIISMRKELQTPEGSSRKWLQDAGSSLFTELLEPVLGKIKNRKRLVILPYNEISYLPFEMLVDPSDGSLLLKKFAISYNYSAGFLSGQQKIRGIKYDVLAMAPFYETGNAMLVLPALESSLDEIASLPGKKLSGAEATKKQFESLSGLFPVIHLATHAVANDTNLLGSYIEFYGLKNQHDTLHRLYEQEIYTLEMKSARLVILSACETGNGLLVNGEGIMSLSRAFSYAGCRSVITSLWKADELSTSFITKRLHKYLQKGLAIDEALQKAKMDYLENKDIGERFKNPAYWANLVLIGNIHPVVERGTNWLMWIEFFVVGMVFLILFIKKTRHRNMPGSFL